jgi:hypothetical protein
VIASRLRPRQRTFVSASGMSAKCRNNPAIGLITVLGDMPPAKVTIKEFTTGASVWTNISRRNRHHVASAGTSRIPANAMPSRARLVALSGRANRADECPLEGNDGHDADVAQCLLFDLKQTSDACSQVIVVGAYGGVSGRANRRRALWRPPRHGQQDRNRCVCWRPRDAGSDPAYPRICWRRVHQRRCARCQT